MIKFDVIKGTLDEDERTALAEVLETKLAHTRGRIEKSGRKNYWGSPADQFFRHGVFNPGAFRTVSYL